MLSLFKTKAKVNPEMSIIKISIDGVDYGFAQNWFKVLPNGGIQEVSIQELPQALLSYHISGIVQDARRQMDAMVDEFANAMQESITKFVKNLEEKAKEIA